MSHLSRLSAIRALRPRLAAGRPAINAGASMTDPALGEQGRAVPVPQRLPGAAVAPLKPDADVEPGPGIRRGRGTAPGPRRWAAAGPAKRWRPAGSGATARRRSGRFAIDASFVRLPNPPN